MILNTCIRISIKIIAHFTAHIKINTIILYYVKMIVHIHICVNLSHKSFLNEYNAVIYEYLTFLFVF